MFGKLAEAQQKAEEVKSRLSNITVNGQAGNGLVKVTADGNRKIKDIDISPELMQADRREELQDLLLLAIENTLEQAENVSQSEMQAMMNAMMPGLSSLLGKK